MDRYQILKEIKWEDLHPTKPQGRTPKLTVKAADLTEAYEKMKKFDLTLAYETMKEFGGQAEQKSCGNCKYGPLCYNNGIGSFPCPKYSLF